MDPMSLIILLLVSFLALQQGLETLFYLTFIVLIVLARSVPITVIGVLVLAMVYFGYSKYWWIFLGILAGIILYGAAKSEKGGGEYYSPELMRLLGG